MLRRLRASALVVGLALVSASLAGCGGAALPSSVAVESPVATESTASTGPTAATVTEAPSDTPVPATPAPATPSPTPGPPPQPGDPTWTYIGGVVGDSSTVLETYRATWTEPEGAATQFLFYGVTTCLRYTAANDGTPCVVKGMKIPSKSLVLLKKVKGTARSADVQWTRDAGAGPEPYWTVLVRAINAAGKSKFTIMWSADVCWECAY